MLIWYKCTCTTSTMTGASSRTGYVYTYRNLNIYLPAPSPVIGGEHLKQNKNIDQTKSNSHLRTLLWLILFLLFSMKKIYVFRVQWHRFQTIAIPLYTFLIYLGYMMTLLLHNNAIYSKNCLINKARIDSIKNTSSVHWVTSDLTTILIIKYVWLLLIWLHLIPWTTEWI